MASKNLTPFYIKYTENDVDVFVELLATSTVQVTATNKTSDNPIRTGSTISDDIISNPTKILFRGRTSSYVTTDPDRDTQGETIDILKKLAANKALVSVLFSSTGSEDPLDKEVYDNCAIVSFGRRKNSETANGWDVDIQFKQLSVAKTLAIGEVSVVAVRASTDFQSTATPETNVKNQTVDVELDKSPFSAVSFDNLFGSE